MNKLTKRIDILGVGVDNVLFEEALGRMPNLKRF